MPREWKAYPDVSGDSPFAMRLPGDFDDRRGSRERKRGEKVEHLVVHMTGRTIVGKAVRAGHRPLDAALAYYTGKATSSHYLIGYAGELWQMTDDHLRVGHVGVEAPERARYLDGSWALGAADHEGRIISRETVGHWRAAWPNYDSPQHLFRGPSVNSVSVGVEMPPCRHSGGEYVAEPLRPGLWHTAAQHVAAAVLACDVATRWRWRDGWQLDPRGGPRSPAIPGHEDLDLFGRSQRTGGWDPGALRSSPRWCWDTVNKVIAWRLTATTIREFLTRVIGELGRAAAGVF